MQTMQTTAMQSMAPPAEGFTTAGHHQNQDHQQQQQQQQHPAAPDPEPKETTATDTSTTKSSTTSPTAQTQIQAPLSPHNVAENSDTSFTRSSNRQSLSPPKSSARRSADRSSLSLSQPQRVQGGLPQPSVSPHPAPEADAASPLSPLDPVAEDETDSSAAQHQHLASAASRPNQLPSPLLGPATDDITTSSPPTSAPHDLQRSSTFPLASSAKDNVEDQPSPATADVASPTARRAPASRSSFGVATSDGPPPSRRTQRAQSTESSASVASTPETRSPRDSGGQRELLLLKSLSQTSPPEDRRASTHRPPVSYKPPVNAAPATAAPQNGAANSARVPPIRSFRSSGSRKSLTLDMNFTPQTYDRGNEPSDGNYDRTLRALEGRQIQDMLQMTPPASARNDGSDADDSGDVFLKIAREEGSRRYANQDSADETQSSVSRTYRSHRRPLSTNVASYQPRSPPFMSRRMSDQQERSRSTHDEDRTSDISRTMTQRTYSREQKAASVHPGDDPYRPRTGGAALRPSPLTPRSMAYQDSGSENPIHTRRRSSIDQNSTPPVRSHTYKTSGHGYGKSYNSSPLVRSFDFQGQHPHQTEGQGMEGTESTASTTAPSTMWDELDELKSRINRLELTGKLPSTSAAAVSRLSDERPPTATTTATTMSSSPKRNGGQQNDTTSTTSSQKEAYPILHSALSKSKPFLSPDIFRALEAAANDAMGLAALTGQPGQPGPISSGASTIGSGTTVTDRQLRRKADSVCRSLTELAVALGEDVAQVRAPQQGHSQKLSQGQSQTQYHPSSHSTHSEGPSTPTINKSFNGLHSRRPSLAADVLPKPSTSPTRTMSKFEERRNTILNGTALPSPRASGSTPTTPQETSANRRSSLLVSRTRRAVTEEPEEPSVSSTGRRSSLLLRSRRGATEEPEEGRQTSMLRSRRGTMEEGDPEPRFSAPSRAYTEVNATRGPKREYTEVAASARTPAREYASQSYAQAQAPAQASVQTPAAPAQDSPSTQGSALPRRRFVSTSTTASRLPAPPSALPTRSYGERSAGAPVQEREPAYAEKSPEARPQRYYSLGQNMSLNRTGSLSTRRANRDSTITNSSTTAATGNYR